MKVLVGFLAGIAVGMWAVILYMDGPEVGQVFSEKVKAVTHMSSLSKLGQVTSPSTEIVQITQTPSPTPSPEPTNTPTPKPTATPTPTLTPTPKPVQPKLTSSEVSGFVDRFAAQYGVDPNVLRAIAVCESGFDPTKISSNGLYVGLYQFSSGAWKSSRQEMGEDTNPDLRLNAEEAAQTAAYAVSTGKGGIWPNCVP
jgi:hypothetical protein